MKLLCIGDVVGECGLAFLADRLPPLKAACGADFVVVNGENADKTGIGIPRAAAEELLRLADVVTTGNHCYHRASEDLYTENPRLVHPANMPFTDAENGCCVIDTGRLGDLVVLNLSGVAFLDPLDNPFKRADELLALHPARFAVVDFHAESTAEKKAFAYYLDGRVSAVFGTHTHVQTADEQVLPGGTGYITDAGMTGPEQSVIGVEPACAIQRQRQRVPVRFRVAEGPCLLNGVLFTLDDKTGRCTGVRRILEREGEKFSPTRYAEDH